MKCYLVLGWDDYYPAPDNSLGIFLNQEEAEEFLKSYQDRADNWAHCDNYEIVEKQVK